MITPLDIQQKVFRRSLRGYEMESVDRFIDQLAESYDNLYLENQSLKEKLDNYDTAIQRYTQMEKSITDTLILAQKNAEDLQNNTRQEADLLLEEARLKAAHIITEAEEKSAQIKLHAQEAGKYKVDEAENQIKKTKEEFYFLNKQIQMYRIKFRSLLDAQISLLNETGQDFSEFMLDNGTDETFNEEAFTKTDNKTEIYQTADDETETKLAKSDNNAEPLADKQLEDYTADESASTDETHSDNTSANKFVAANETAASTGSDALKLNFSMEDEDWRMEKRRIGS